MWEHKSFYIAEFLGRIFDVEIQCENHSHSQRLKIEGRYFYRNPETMETKISGIVVRQWIADGKGRERTESDDGAV